MQGTLLGKVDVGNASFPPVFPTPWASTRFQKKVCKSLLTPHPTPIYRLHVMQTESHRILTAVADSVATGLPVDVAIPDANVDAAIRFLRSRFMDVDWDGFPNRVTIFGDDQRVHVSEDGDGDEGHWVLNLVVTPVPFVDTNAI
jgi:hypothetical protein